MTMPRPSLVTVENYDTLRESIPSFFMREISVVRLTSIRIAAPLGPATRPCVSSSTRRISSRSLDSRGLDVGTAAPARLSSRPELQERCREFKDECRSMTAPSIEGQYNATASLPYLPSWRSLSHAARRQGGGSGILEVRRPLRTGGELSVGRGNLMACGLAHRAHSRRYRALFAHSAAFPNGIPPLGVGRHASHLIRRIVPIYALLRHP
jgi:hypothetical protein